MMLPRVIVTRPLREAERWVRDLRARGWVAQALPLIDILPALDEAAVRQARAELGDYQAAMFVSGNAVRYFLGLAQQGCVNGSATGQNICLEPFLRKSCFFESPSATALPAALPGGATRAWATGPGTVRALTALGWPRARIDAPDLAAGEQADSEALWARVAGQIGPGARVLVVRGGDAAGRPAGRAWLADQLTAAGARVQTVVAYRRAPPAWDAAQRQCASAAARDGSVWLISSSEAAANLRDLARAASPEQEGVGQAGALDLHRARALVTHPRIARAAREAGFGEVAESDGPTLEAVIRSIE